MVRHTVGIAHFADSLEATVFDLPGCHTSAGSEEALQAQLPLAIAEFELWLTLHGEPVVPRSQFDIVERVAAAETNAADGEFTFAWDRRTCSVSEIETALRWMSAMLESCVRPLPPMIASI